MTTKGTLFGGQPVRGRRGKGEDDGTVNMTKVYYMYV
jgi:hypothetical protein